LDRFRFNAVGPRTSIGPTPIILALIDQPMSTD